MLGIHINGDNDDGEDRNPDSDIQVWSPVLDDKASSR